MKEIIGKLRKAKFRTLEEVYKHTVEELDALEKRLKLMGEEKVAKLI